MIFITTNIPKMNKEQEGKGVPTPVVPVTPVTPVAPIAPIARLLRAIEPQETTDDFSIKNSINSSTHSGLDSYNDWVAKGSPAGGLIEVALDAVVLDEEMQIRKRTDPNIVQRYADGIESGSPFPPITLACIEGVLVLVDGWHRFYARQSLREAMVVAFVSTMSYEEALCASALANLANGVSLKPSEVKDAFHTFMQNYGYRIGYSWLSYREIAKKFGVHYTTIRNWIMKHYPKVFNHYKLKEAKSDYKTWDGVPSGPGKRLSKADLLAVEVVKQAQVALKNTKNLRESLTPNTRGVLVEALRETLEELEKLPYFLPDF